MVDQSVNFIEMEKHAYCTAEEFKSDISQLCGKCPLKEEIEEAVVGQIIFQAKERKQLCSREEFIKYVESEVEEAQGSMDRVFIAERQQKGNNDGYRNNRIKVYIWNKERIKALNKLKPRKFKFSPLQIALWSIGIIVGLLSIYNFVQSLLSE